MYHYVHCLARQVAHLERSGHYLTVKDNQVRVCFVINFTGSKVLDKSYIFCSILYSTTVYSILTKPCTLPYSTLFYSTLFYSTTLFYPTLPCSTLLRLYSSILYIQVFCMLLKLYRKPRNNVSESQTVIEPTFVLPSVLLYSSLMVRVSHWRSVQGSETFFWVCDKSLCSKEFAIELPSCKSI